jgi:chemotaxis signal transduction protein
VLWRGVYVPVVAVEQMCDIATASAGPRARIAIIYNPQKDPDLAYLGIHMQDIPRAYLAEPESTESGSSEGLSDYLVTRVDDEQLQRVIPDFDKIIADLKREYSPARLKELKK